MLFPCCFHDVPISFPCSYNNVPMSFKCLSDIFFFLKKNFLDIFKTNICFLFFIFSLIIVTFFVICIFFLFLNYSYFHVTLIVQDLYSFHLFQMPLHCWMMISLFTMLDKQQIDACLISPQFFSSSPHQTLQFGQTDV